jgi:putative NADH-flavin reductase
VTVSSVLVLGATGSIGRFVVEELLARGHRVTAFSRSASRFGGLAGHATPHTGDALDGRAVSRAVAGQDAVVYTLGAGNVCRTTLFSESTKILLRGHGCARRPAPGRDHRRWRRRDEGPRRLPL